MQTTLRSIVPAILAFLATTALAQEPPTKVTLGERTPELKATHWANYKGTPTLEKFKDRIVVLFFFRTDDTSVDSIPTLNEIHKNFHETGVRVIGLTPQKKEKAEGIVKGKQVQFIVGYGAKTEERYQVSSFPKVYLLDTAGRLVNRFHPEDELEEKIRAQIRKTPPTGADPQTLKIRFGQAKNAFRSGEYGKAYTLARDLAKLTDRTSTIGKAVAELIKQVEEAARKRLVEAKKAAQAESYDEACRILAELSVRFEGHDIGGDADTEIGRLMGTRQLKPKLRQALDNAKGQLLNDQAADHATSSRYLEALGLYREVTEEYPNTEAGRAAEEALDNINSDPMAQDTIRKLWADEEADRWLDIADRFAKVEMYDKAREFYQRVIETHPTARAAPKAEERLTKLPEVEPEAESDPLAEVEGGDNTPDGEGR